MKNQMKMKRLPNTLVALRDEALTQTIGGGLWSEVKDFMAGLGHGYKDHDKDENMVYGGPDGLDPPNA